MENTLQVSANNKIIDREMILEIIDAMRQELAKCEKIYEEEKAKNEPLKYEYQKWTLNHFDGKIKYTIFFMDNNSVTYDDYDHFITVFKNRVFSIRHLIIDYTISYNKDGKFIYNSLNLSATEDRFAVSSNFANGDTYMRDVYDLIAQKITAAPPKYDRIVKAKELINLKIGFAIGMIPAIVLITASAFIPQLHDFYKNFFYMFPILILLLAVVFGFFLGSTKTSGSYAKLVPQKYGGYDKRTQSSYYQDDIQKITETSEVLIGNNTNNNDERRHILEMEKRFTNLIPVFLGAAAVVTVIMFFLTR